MSTQLGQISQNKYKQLFCAYEASLTVRSGKFWLTRGLAHVIMSDEQSNSSVNMHARLGNFLIWEIMVNYVYA